MMNKTVTAEDVLHQLDYWFARPLGKVLVNTESRALEQLFEHKFGHYLVQLGGPKRDDYLHTAISQRIYLSPEIAGVGGEITLEAKFEGLPFLPNSIDVVVAPHTLEFAHRPQKVIAEIYQILIPEGWAAFVGFNPVSLWGVARMFANRKKIPWCANLVSVHRLSHWLTKAGFTIMDYKTYFFRLPFKKKKSLDKAVFMEIAGQLVWANCGAIYILLAKKSVLGLTPIKNRAEKLGVSVAGSYARPAAGRG